MCIRTSLLQGKDKDDILKTVKKGLASTQNGPHEKKL